MPSIKATLYERPNGKKSVITLTDNDIKNEDAQFIYESSIKLSLEPLDNGTDNIIIYADYGKVTEEGEPDEYIMFSRGREAIECMSELCKALKPLIEQEQNNND